MLIGVTRWTAVVLQSTRPNIAAAVLQSTGCWRLTSHLCASSSIDTNGALTGDIDLHTGHANSGTSGSLSLSTGSSTNGATGDLLLATGAGNAAGGIAIFAGTSNDLMQEGSTVVVESGASMGSMPSGDVLITTADASHSGALTLST